MAVLTKDYWKGMYEISYTENEKLRAEIERLKQQIEAEAEYQWSLRAENERLRTMLKVTVFLGNGGWWASMTRQGHYLGRMDRGPYRWRWMAKLAFPIDRWIW